MKKLFFLLIISFVWFSCDKVEPPFVEENLEVSSEKVVLVEDFTAHLCNNCPFAHRKLEELKMIYGEKIVSIGIHVGALAVPLTATYYPEDFRTETGDELDEYYGASAAGLPIGMVNRKKISGSELLPYDEWASAIQQILETPQTLEITTDVNYVESSRSINLTSKIEVINTFENNGNLMICFYLIEDSIIGWQKDAGNESNEDVSNYIHRNVLRTSLNGTWGQTIDLDPQVEGNTVTINLNSFVVDTLYNVNNCYIVSFVYEDNDNEILQADKVKIVVN